MAGYNCIDYQVNGIGNLVLLLGRFFVCPLGRGLVEPQSRPEAGKN
jgi:hypothetical protein